MNKKLDKKFLTRTRSNIRNLEKFETYDMYHSDLLWKHALLSHGRENRFRKIPSKVCISNVEQV